MKAIYIQIRKCKFFLFVFFYSFLLVIGIPNYTRAQLSDRNPVDHGIEKAKDIPVGHIVPDLFWDVSHRMLNKKDDRTFTFRQEKGKFILLDFWATWCTVCARGFPKVDSLHQNLKDNVAVVLVNQKGNRDTKESIRAFFERYHNRYPYAMDMPQIYQDSVLGQYFQHRSIPHYVLISPSGKVLVKGSIHEFGAITEILKYVGSSLENKVDSKRRNGL